jgi:RNase H-like domain found in reverse transcriptase
MLPLALVQRRQLEKLFYGTWAGMLRIPRLFSNARMRWLPLPPQLILGMKCVYVFSQMRRKGFGRAVVTQVPPKDLGKPLADQRHEPLAFISGAFKGASSRWPIVEKEAFAIVETTDRLVISFAPQWIQSVLRSTQFTIHI